jgi:hypothetical protein
MAEPGRGRPGKGGLSSMPPAAMGPTGIRKRTQPDAAGSYEAVWHQVVAKSG